MTATPAQKPAKRPIPDKSKIVGLPPEADLQWSGDRLVVFYRYRTKKQESRKYLGWVTDMTFRPNMAFQTNPSSFEVPQKKPVGRRANILREQKPYEPSKDRLRLLGQKADYNTAVGGPLFLMQCWHEVQADKDLFDSLVEVYGENKAKALYSKTVTTALFMAHTGCDGKWQIGSWCRTHTTPTLMTDQGVSDLYKALGEKGDELKAAFIRRRVERLGKEEFIAMDGTNIGCSSQKNILVKAGKGKSGVVRDQISVSYLFSSTSGLPAAYDLLPGNMADIGTMAAYLDRWNALDLKGKRIRASFDRGYYKHETLKTFCKSGVEFLVAAKTDLKMVSGCISECMDSVEDYLNWNHAKKCFGTTKEVLLDTNDEDTKVYVHVYLNPKVRAKELDKFSNALEKANVDWNCGKGEFDTDLAQYFETPVRGKPLEPKRAVIRETFKSLGFFALVTNCYTNCHAALNHYTMRNAIEVCFKTAKSQTGLSKVRVHSEEAFKGKAFINFFAVLGASVVMNKLAYWKMPKEADKTSLQPLNRNTGYQKLLGELECVRLQKTAGCSPYVNNATKRVKAMMDQLRVELLYDQPQRIMDLLLELPSSEPTQQTSQPQSASP